MTHTMLDVLIYLFEHYLEEGRDVPGDEGVLKTMLEDAGFPQSEIDKAFVWLEDLVRQRDEAGEDGEAAPASFRVFSREESAKLSRECRGYVALLEQSGVLDPRTRELVIERAMALELDELDLDKFKLIVMMVLSNQAGEEQHMQTWIEALVFDTASGRLH